MKGWTASYAVLVYGLLACTLLARFIVEYVWLLPSPVGDGAFFLTASVNYCRSNFLGTTAFPIDPSGQARMVWHGFVSPMLFGSLDPRCSAVSFFVDLWFVRALTTAGIVFLARLRKYSPLVTVGLAAFALALQYQCGFRPETLAILLIVLVEIALEYDQDVMVGALMGTLLCTQPTVAGLHGLVMLVTRFSLVNRWLRIGLGYFAAVFFLVAIYPYPIHDLISGILLQARRVAGRSDGDVLSYYLLAPALPAWGILFLVAWGLAALRKPLLVLTLPVLWFFGPRLPPISYNVMPICFFLLVLVCTWSPGRVANLLSTGSLIVGALGLGLLTARDALTIHTYGDTFRTTSDTVSRFAARGDSFAVAPPFLALTNPDLRITDPTFVHASAPRANGDRLSLYAVNGRPKTPCPGDGPDTPVGLQFAKRTIFNSNSGWIVYSCTETKE